MKRYLPIFLILLMLGLIIFLVYFFRDRFNKKPAGLEINTTPAAQVFLEGQNVGTTPYKNQGLDAGTYTLRLVPEAVDGNTFPPWETRLELASLVTTVINHTFAASEADSSGSILQLLHEPGDKTYLSVISEPDTVSVTIDGKPNGFTPATKLESTPGSHALVLSSPGYKTQELTVNTAKGYNLLVNVKLGVDQIVLTPPAASFAPVASSSASPAPVAADQITQPYVIVSETGTGWLRVRQEPSATAPELGKANVGEKLKYLGESTETGWHKIEFEDQDGWVSGKYVDLVK